MDVHRLRKGLTWSIKGSKFYNALSRSRVKLDSGISRYDRHVTLTHLLSLGWTSLVLNVPSSRLLVPMRILFSFLLHTIHFIYILFTKARLFWKQISSATPKPLQAPRRRIPKHLAVVFIFDPNIHADTVQTILIESALNIIEWCQTTGIPKLTLYEEHGARH